MQYDSPFHRIGLFVVMACLVPVLARADSGSPIPYSVLEPGGVPAGYRSWTHVKSMLIHDAKHPLFGPFGGIHHVYANPAAAKVLTSGGSRFPDGAVLVFDLLEAKDVDGAYTEGTHKLRAVMVKDAKAFPKSGGWGFEAFKGDGKERVVTDGGSECFACHQQRQGNDYVFSEYRR